MIIRHAEKPDATHPGIDETSHPDDKSLTARGWDRARALPHLFASAPGQTPPQGLPRPASIFATTPDGPSGSPQRPRQTVTPLATALGLQVDTSYAEGQEQRLAAAALRAPAPVLICWEQAGIPALVQALGAAGAGVPKQWPDRFDLVWVFTRTGSTWSFHQVSQHLLNGDT